MILDCTNKACPIPVIETKKTLEKIGKDETICVTVDNFIATQNLEKLAVETNCKFEVTKVNDDLYKFYITRGDNLTFNDVKVVNDNDYLVVVNTNSIGKQNDIGYKLIEMYFYTLTEVEVLPKAIVFYNEGVLLTTQNENVISDLKKLVERGVDVYSCGACLDFYKAELKVGEVTNMLKIVELMNSAKKVVNL